MNTSELIRQSLNHVFIFYAHSAKRIFNLSVIYSLFWSCISLVVTIPLLLGLWFIGIGEDVFQIEYYDNESIFSNPLYISRFKNFVSAFSIMSIPLFGIYLGEKRESFEKTKLNQILTFFNQKHWQVWILFMFGIILFYVLTFNLKIREFNFEPKDYQYLALYSNQDRWPDLVFELFKLYLPFMTAMAFTMMYYSDSVINKDILSRYKNALLATLIISFIIQALLMAALDYYKTYVETLFFEIPFLDNIFPSLLGLIVQLAFIAYLFAAVAIGFTYPFKHISEKNKTEDTENKTDILG